MLASLMGPDGLIVVVVLVVVLFFGGSKLPSLARGLGSASREFKKGVEEGTDEPSATKTEDSSPTGAL